MINNDYEILEATALRRFCTARLPREAGVIQLVFS